MITEEKIKSAQRLVISGHVKCMISLLLRHDLPIQLAQLPISEHNLFIIGFQWAGGLRLF